MKDDKVYLLVVAGMVVNILAIGLGITSTDYVYLKGVCMLANIISLAVLTMILMLNK